MGSRLMHSEPRRASFTRLGNHGTLRNLPQKAKVRRQARRSYTIAMLVTLAAFHCEKHQLTFDSQNDSRNFVTFVVVIP